MPFYFICLYNEVLDLVDPQLIKKLFEENIYWQEWEKFVTYHETFRTNLAIRLGKAHKNYIFVLVCQILTLTIPLN
jgi:hypothetical protein